jgi:hypothetical protein
VNGETAREKPRPAPRSRPWGRRRRRSSRPPCSIFSAPAPAEFWVPMPPSATFAFLSPLIPFSFELVRGLVFLAESSRRAGPEVNFGAVAAPVPRIGSTRSTAAGEKAPLCRRSPLRPHRGHYIMVLVLRGSMPPCSSLKRVWLVARDCRWRRRQSPVPLLRNGRDLSPQPSKTALPCGPRSSKLLAAPHPFLKF